MKPILVVTYWSFNDALIQTYTLPYVKIMARVSKRKIYLVCLEQSHLAATKTQQQQINEELKHHNIEVVFFTYNRFGLKQALLWGVNLCKLIYLIIGKRVEYLHAWCTPGGAIGYLLSVITGRPLILDSYEPHAELMLETNTWARSGLAFKILFKLEKLQTKRAKAIIGVVSKMTEYSLEKYNFKINQESFYVKPACVDFEKFHLRNKDQELLNSLQLNGKIVCVYAGKFGGIYLEDELFDFLAQCYAYWGDRFVMLMLTNASEESVIAQLNRVELPLKCVVQKFVFHADIPRYMALGDFAVNFMKPVPARRYSAPIKDGEYWAMGLPMVITEGISDDSDIVRDNDIGYVLKELSKNEYRSAVKNIDRLLKEKPEIKVQIEQVAKKYRSFELAENVYEAIYTTHNW